MRRRRAGPTRTNSARPWARSSAPCVGSALLRAPRRLAPNKASNPTHVFSSIALRQFEPLADLATPRGRHLTIGNRRLERVSTRNHIRSGLVGRRSRESAETAPTMILVWLMLMTMSRQVGAVAQRRASYGVINPTLTTIAAREYSAGKAAELCATLVMSDRLVRHARIYPERAEIPHRRFAKYWLVLSISCCVIPRATLRICWSISLCRAPEAKPPSCVRR